MPTGISFGAKIRLLACHNLNMNAMEKITVEDHLKMIIKNVHNRVDLCHGPLTSHIEKGRSLLCAEVPVRIDSIGIF